MPASPSSATTSRGSNFFNGSSSPSNPGLQDSSSKATGVHSALEQLSSAAKSSAEAAKNPGAAETSKDVAGCALGADACRTPDPLAYPKSAAHTPDAVELASHVPEDIRKDPKIQTDLKFYEDLEKRKIERQATIANVQQQIDKGAGDPAVLKAKMTTLDNDGRRDDGDQAAAAARIKARVVVDLHRTWDEGLKTTSADAMGQSGTSAR
jgi:hypothetical protein